jgi:L-seryl-tRNA(Ser) seleniumtransferase
MLASTVEELAARARRLADRLASVPGLAVTVVAGASTPGGGSAPGSTLPTALVELRAAGAGPDALDRRLRTLPTPVVARIENGRVVLDLRTVFPSQDEELAGLLAQALAP